MTREITQGQIDRYVRRAQSLYGATKYFEWASTQPVYLGRRATLKALRDLMGPSRRAMQRAARRAMSIHPSWAGQSAALINADLGRVWDVMRYAK